MNCHTKYPIEINTIKFAFISTRKLINTERNKKIQTIGKINNQMIKAYR